MAVGPAAAAGLRAAPQRYLARVGLQPAPTHYEHLNGGSHAGNNVNVQEFMVMPWPWTPAEALRVAGISLPEKSTGRARLPTAVATSGSPRPESNTKPLIHPEGHRCRPVTRRAMTCALSGRGGRIILRRQKE
jgi:hypothetical protein